MSNFPHCVVTSLTNPSNHFDQNSQKSSILSSEIDGSKNVVDTLKLAILGKFSTNSGNTVSDLLFIKVSEHSFSRKFQFHGKNLTHESFFTFFVTYRSVFSVGK